MSPALLATLTGVAGYAIGVLVGWALHASWTR